MDKSQHPATGAKFFTFAEIAFQFDNGFHDAQLYGYSVDLKKGQAEIYVGIDTSMPPEKHPTYLDATVVFTGIKGFIVEPIVEGSAAKSFLSLTEGVGCDAGILEGERLDKVTSSIELKACQAVWFFLNETNSFIYVFWNDVKTEKGEQ
jgi:hypothetical protein